MNRVAVQAGAAWVRLAVDDPRPRLLAELPAAGDPVGVIAGALASLLDRPADELIVVHGAGPPPAVPPGAAAVVRTVPAAVAALASWPDLVPYRPSPGHGGAASWGGALSGATSFGGVSTGGTASAWGGGPPGGTASAWRGVSAEGPWAGQGDARRSAGPVGGGPAVHAVVVDVGWSGAEITRVCAGRVVAACRIPVGGAALDDVTARLCGRDGPAARSVAQAVREALSLLPVARAGTPVEPDADALRRALRAPLAPVVAAVVAAADPASAAGAGGAGPRVPPVLLIGGVARTPLLADLLDAEGLPDVRVAERPDSAAVVGALRLPPHLPRPPPVPARPRRPGPAVPVPNPTPSVRAVSASRLPAPGSDVPGPAVPQPAAPAGPAAFWLPPVAPARRRPLRALAVGTAAAVALAGLHAVGTALPVADNVPLAAAGDLVQYGYAVRLPAGWAHTGGLPERRRSLLTPVAAPDGGDLVSVERTPLGYDADAEPQRARAELRAEFARAVAEGAMLSGFDGEARYAGRPVVAYREAVGDVDAAEVTWYVVLDRDAQLSVGCRHTPAGARMVEAACATVVGSVRRTA